jgi:DNA polymerase I-like protein with 3'-5' exonuclease and polymerase domains
VVGYDTEGDPSGYWGKVWFQVCFDPGCSLVFRQGSPHFDDNVRGFADWLARTGATLAIHNAMHDLEISRGIGLELFDVPIFDTQYAAYLLRVEPQGLKPLAYRHCGMRMASYQDTVGDIGLEKQLGYLSRILELSPWPKPEPELEYGNDGSCRLKTPQPVERRAEAILADYYSGKLDKDGNRTDPYDRWRKVVPQLRNMVELRMGRMPIGTLDDIPLDSAVFYAGRDPDATVRLYGALVKLLERNGLLQLMADGMAVYPVFEEMQASGMLATRQYFEDLGAEMWDKMCTLQAYISHHFWDGLPFNPASPPQVRELMRRRGLKGEKKTKTKVVSTGKKSVEHLRYTDDAMAHVIDWREHQKIRDSFCDPIIDRIGDRAEHRVRTTIKTTRTATRRVSASNPNLTAIPVRNELGLRVRGGFVAAPGCVLGSWDLSQVEMRYMAHLSGDDLLIRFLLEGRDPHAETASRIFGIPLADVQEMEHRYPAKRAGFGIITNIQGPGLLDQLRMFGCKGWTENKCDELITEWLKIYKGVAQLLKDCVREVQQNGMVRDEWGHIRYLPGVWSEDRKVRGEAERAASSHKIQGGAQGMIQKSMIWAKPIIRALQVDEPRLKWILQIHDELILEGPEDLMRDVVDPVIREALTEHSKKLVVPVKCSGSLGKTWGEL